MTPEQERPPPDLEEARRRRAELVIEDIDADEAEMKGHLSAHQRECRGVARDFLALLSEREAREEALARIAYPKFWPTTGLGSLTLEQWMQSTAAAALADLPATESAQAASDQPAEQAASEAADLSPRSGMDS